MRKPMPCGFCSGGSCDRCPGSIKNATAPDVNGDRTWMCPCAQAGHPGRVSEEAA